MIARRWTSLLTLCMMLFAGMTGASSPCAGQHDTTMPAMAGDDASMTTAESGESCHRPDADHHSHAPLSCITMSSCATTSAIVTLPRVMAEPTVQRVAVHVIAASMSSVQLPPENPPPRA